MENYRIGDRVAVIGVPPHTPSPFGTVRGIGGQATAFLEILVEFDNGEEFWCDPSELSPAKGK